ncbi:unnamed protein product [Ilex paraguariensis]|uniref:Uncharacterized protein n=1 Tax=Ilex paraguariensis TaxID=185542 RepID=A0ABC8T590_9AQUA
MSAIMLNHPRRHLTSVPSNKRKDRDGLDAVKPLTTSKLAKPSVHRADKPTTPRPSQPDMNNQLLAGYLAHEFLTKGTLFGEPWDPARAEAVPVSTDSAEFRKQKYSQKADEASVKSNAGVEKYQRYVEVADLLKGNGAHLPGIINPTHLSRFMKL